MKTFFKVITLATLATTMGVISAANAAEAQKIGVVFPSKVMQESPQRQRSIKKLESEFKGRYQKLQSLEREIKTLQTKVQKDGELLGNNEVTELKRKLEVKVSEYKLSRKAFEEDQRSRQIEEQQKTLTVIRDVIGSIAKEEQYDIILNGEQIVFSKAGLDISDQVIQKISKK